jgi:hypothetical protein
VVGGAGGIPDVVGAGAGGAGAEFAAGVGAGAWGVVSGDYEVGAGSRVCGGGGGQAGGAGGGVWSAQQVAHQRWLATPKEDREPRARKRWARVLGVDPATLVGWEDLPGFLAQVDGLREERGEEALWGVRLRLHQQWLATPRPGRAPASRGAWAAQLGVSTDTLLRWEQREGFVEEVHRLARVVVVVRFPEVLEELVAAALGRSVPAARLLFEAMGYLPGRQGAVVQVSASASASADVSVNVYQEANAKAIAEGRWQDVLFTLADEAEAERRLAVFRQEQALKVEAWEAEREAQGLPKLWVGLRALGASNEAMDEATDKQINE